MAEAFTCEFCGAKGARAVPCLACEDASAADSAISMASNATRDMRQGSVGKHEIWIPHPEGPAGHASERVLLRFNEHFAFAADMMLHLAAPALLERLGRQVKNLIGWVRKERADARAMSKAATLEHSKWMVQRAEIHACHAVTLSQLRGELAESKAELARLQQTVLDVGLCTCAADPSKCRAVSDLLAMVPKQIARVAGDQDIETAPRDGTRILGWEDRLGWMVVVWDAELRGWRLAHAQSCSVSPSRWRHLPSLELWCDGKGRVR